MLSQLIESKQVRQRRPVVAIVSLVLHAAAIAAAVELTKHTVSALPKPEEVTVLRQTQPPEPKPVDAQRPTELVARAPSRFGHQVLIAPVDVPLDIPPVDMSAAATNVNDWTGQGSPGGRGDGVVGAEAPISSDAPMFEFQVDKAAAALPGTAQPAYPPMLTASGVEGSAHVRFVVDTMGRAEPGSFVVLNATHDAFGAAVKQALPRMRFLPAEAGGKRVRMLVEQSFAFTLNR